jgi:hypothetical protein
MRKCMFLRKHHEDFCYLWGWRAREAIQKLASNSVGVRALLVPLSQRSLVLGDWIHWEGLDVDHRNFLLGRSAHILV